MAFGLNRLIIYTSTGTLLNSYIKIIRHECYRVFNVLRAVDFTYSLIFKKSLTTIL